MRQEDGIRAGRRRASSRGILEEAASELFLENTYDGTTIEQITQRAGVSRNTFFNYFQAKSDVLWASVDEAIASLPEDFARVSASTRPLTAVRAALIAASTRFGPDRLPLAVTQYEVMGTQAELTTSGLTRFLRVAGDVEGFLTSRLGADARPRARVIAFAVAAALAAAADGWARAGTGRHPLSEYVAEAITPICRGFA
ncbi:TetR/AcrR family transcriptional regulator [Rathayibacter soli]|uniref:TetR/AcrR family transcriptional regulator n=1 Tax=Rathayibacter soli TaxID=3144168 RepID=UPI0027E4389C|nr:helix-turn-helix domain-containing protein [Glaciibacter superstes]